jgi:RNA-directed DNA polymerase
VRQYPVKCRRSGYATLIKPSPEGQSRHMAIIRETLKLTLAAEQEEVIKRLNPIIRGWSNYYKHSIASAIFSKIDDYMFHRLWNWACKRHPTKGAGWIKSKYFRRYRENCWRFRTHDGNMLNLHSDTHIKRYIKIQGIRTPFDGDTEYWTQRLGKKFAGNGMMRCA